MRARLFSRVVPILSLLALHAWINFLWASRVQTVGNYDTAWYYSVARNVARGRGLTETMMWHYLGHHGEGPVIRPAGDYWLPFWPFLLGTVFRLIHTDTERASFWICAILSLFVPVLLFFLSLRLFNSTFVAWVSGILFVLQRRLIQTNVTPDVMLVFQISSLLALVVASKLVLQYSALEKFTDSQTGKLSRRLPWRYFVAGVLAALPVLFRTEGIAVTSTVALVLFVRRGADWWFQAAVYFLLGVAIVVGCYVTYDYLSFGQPIPEPRRMFPFFQNHSEMYAFQTEPSEAAWRSLPLLLKWETVRSHLMFNVKGVCEQLPWLLSLCAVLGGVYAVIRANRLLIAPLISAIGFLILPSVLAPVLTHPNRLVLMIAPMLCLLAPSMIAIFLNSQRLRATSVRLMVVSLFIYLCTRVYTPFPNPQDLPVDYVLERRPHLTIPGLKERLGMSGNDLVFTLNPWQVNAVLDVPAVMCPLDGPVAVRKAFIAYSPKYVLAEPNDPCSLGQVAKKFGGKIVAQCSTGTWFLMPGMHRLANESLSEFKMNPNMTRPARPADQGSSLSRQ